MPTVVNKHAVRPESGDVYIGRGSAWGNPYRIGTDGSRDRVIVLYQAWIADRPHLVDALREREPKRLVCFCSPLPCHGDVLASLI